MFLSKWELPFEKFNDRMFKGYLSSLRATGLNNDCKTIGIRNGQRFLIGVLVTIAFIVVYTAITTGLDYIELSQLLAVSR
jgi:hypothetical protein